MGALGEQWLAAPDDSYDIDNSVKMAFEDSAYFSNTPSSAGNRRTWTFSVWIKVARRASATGGGMALFNAGNAEFLISDGDDTLTYIDGGAHLRRTKGVFRDGSAWLHLVVATDTTDGTANDRCKMYINGEQITDFQTNATISQNFDSGFNHTHAHHIGRQGGNYYEGAMSELYIIDGAQREASDFGEYNSEGVWVPKKYTAGSFGTNGVFMEFKQSGTGTDASGLGADTSGQTNHWAVNNMSSDTQSLDTPTNNFCVLDFNSHHREGSCVMDLTGTRVVNTNTAKANDFSGTIAVSEGKWYWETEYDNIGQAGVNRDFTGIAKAEWDILAGTDGASFSVFSTGYSYTTKGEKQNNDSAATYGNAVSAGNIVQTALDMDNGKIWWGINNTWQNSGNPATGANEAYSSISGLYKPAFAVDYGTGNSGLIVNFGQGVADNSDGGNADGNGYGNFKYAPPSGFLALCTKNMPDQAVPDSSTNFQGIAYTGNGSTQDITFTGNANMQPDMIWVRSYSHGDGNLFIDAARGTGKVGYSTQTNEDDATDAVTAFNSDGFSLGDGSELASGTINTSTRTYAAFCWAAGNSGASNTAGTINTTSTFVDATAGISCITYTGDGNDNATIGHGLGATPTTTIVNPRSNGDHMQMTNWETGVSAFTEDVNMNAGDAPNAQTNRVKAASSTLLTLGTDVNVNGSGRTYFAWVFREISGFSRFGTFTGTGNTEESSPMCWCGFMPEMVILFPVSTGDNKEIRDGFRGNLFNPIDHSWALNSSDAASTNTGHNVMDLTANGFKMRSSSSGHNSNDVTYVFAAFAKRPFGGGNVAPGPAQAQWT